MIAPNKMRAIIEDLDNQIISLMVFNDYLEVFGDCLIAKYEIMVEEIREELTDIVERLERIKRGIK